MGSKDLRHAIVWLFLVSLLAISSAAYAAVTGTMQQQNAVAPATPPAACLATGTCPPQGTITITAPQAGKTWYTGSYQVIQWTCNGTRSNSVDVTLWRNSARAAVIWTGVATGRTAYIVPFGAPPGSYEVRVTSQVDSRVEARLPVTIVATSVTLATPPTALLTGTPYTITWSYTGNFASAKLAVLDSSGAVVQQVPVSPGSNGQGSFPWMAPALPAGKTSVQYRFQISGIFHADVTNNDARVEKVLGATDLFTVRLPKLQASARFLVDTGVARCSPGRQYPLPWTSELNGRPVKIELYKASTVLQTIQASVPSHATNSIVWTAPSIPETLTRTYLKIRVTSLDFPALTSDTGLFECERPGIAITSPNPDQNLVMNQTYQIAWEYYGDPGRHVRIDLMSSDVGGYNLQVFDTPAQSTAMQASSGQWGRGQFSWTLTNRGPRRLFYIQLKGVEDPSVWDRQQYYIETTGASGTTGMTTSSGTTSTGSSSGTSGSSGSSTTGTSGTSSGSSSSGTSGSSGSMGGATQMLTHDTSIKYNPTDSATFIKNTTVKLDANGYAVDGYLAMTDQSLKYGSGKSAVIFAGSRVGFESGYAASGFLTTRSGHTLEYGPGASAQFHPGSHTTFKNGYVASSFLKVGSNQSLNYKAGRSAYFHNGSRVNFSNGCAVSGYLALGSDQSLEYRSGKLAQFWNGSFVVFRPGGYVKSAFLGASGTFETGPGKSQAVPRLSYVTFDDNGYLASFNPPGFSACYQCNQQTDPACSNSGGLPPCQAR